MDIPASLITRITEQPNALSEIIDAGVTEDLFPTDDKQYYVYCRDYYRQYGAAPTSEVFALKYPDFDRWHNSTAPTAWFISELRRNYKRRALLEISREVAKQLMASHDPDEILESTVRGPLLRVDQLTSESTDQEWSSQDARKARVERYDEVKANDGKVGLITPFPTLNAHFQFRHEGLYILVARQGIGKTWLLCALARHAWLTEKKPVVIDTREMPIEQITARLDSIAYGIPCDKLVRGDLDYQQEVSWRNRMNTTENVDVPLVVVEESGGVSSDASKIEKYNADSLWIDGAYMIPDERGALQEWQQITNVCRDLKRLAKRTKRVIIITLQFNRSATNTEGDASHIALGDVAKEADGILGLFRSEDQKYNNRATLKVLKNRHSLECDPIELEWDLDRGIVKEADNDIDFGAINSKSTQQKPSTTAWTTWQHDTDVEF